jgi:anti-sigma-K factor RskA
VSEGSRFRTYILMALPVGDANPLQKRKDVREQQRRAVDRNRESFRELDQQIQQRQQPR